MKTLFITCLLIIGICTTYGQTNFTYDSLDLEVVFIQPQARHVHVGQYEKLELGIKLPDEILDAIDEFLNNPHATFLNPYDPDQINVEALFYNETDTLKTYGFYYKDYARDMRTNNTWKDIYTEHNFRVRFAPPKTGKWNCNIQVTFPNTYMKSIYKNGITFTCSDKAKKGFIAVADDKRHFKYAGTGESYFAIGQNIPWTDEPFFKGNWANGNMEQYYFKNKEFKERLYRIGFEDMNEFVKNAGDNNANMVRVVSWQDSYLFEWEERGVYGSNRTTGDQNFLRQKRAWELDQLINAAETKDVKLLFCLEFQGQYMYDWNNGDAYSYYFNPYNKVVKEGITDTKLPLEFFKDRTLMNDYKKKLRYFMARWGYSPSLGIVQLLSELDGWCIDSANVHTRLNSIIRKDPQVQTNLKNWHDEMGQYLHTIASRPIIVTSGLMITTRPTDIPFARNFYNTQGIDMVCWNYYGNDRSENYTMSVDAQNFLKTYNKPFLFTETGMMTNPEKNADPSDLEGCDDVMFHNFLWAGSAMGAPGTSLEWWQAFDNKRRENFKALHAFYSTLDFNANNFTEADRWIDKGTALYLCGNIRRLINKNSMIEVYYVRTNKNKKEVVQQAHGWVHNLSNYWGNLTSYTNCPDRNNRMAVNKNCSDDDYSEPVVLNPTDYSIKIKGLKPKKDYAIEWHNTRGEGGLFLTTTATSTGGGTLFINWPGNDFDYAFKLTEVTLNKEKK